MFLKFVWHGQTGSSGSTLVQVYYAGIYVKDLWEIKLLCFSFHHPSFLLFLTEIIGVMKIAGAQKEGRKALLTPIEFSVCTNIGPQHKY